MLHYLNKLVSSVIASSDYHYISYDLETDINGFIPRKTEIYPSSTGA